MANEGKRERMLQAVLADPDADEPRFAYASHCDEEGDPRGEFIRVQIDAAHAKQGGQLVEWNRFDIRARELSQAYETEWAGRVVELVEEFNFYRGFVESIRISGAELLANGAEIQELAPVRHLDFSEVAPVFDELIASRFLESVRSISFEGCGLGDRKMKQLSESSVLGELRWLSLRNNDVTLDGADHLAASTGLPKLGYVNFARNPCDPRDGYALDVGFINETWQSEAGAILEDRHGPIPWLRRPGEAADDLEPDRLIFAGAP